MKRPASSLLLFAALSAAGVHAEAFAQPATPGAAAAPAGRHGGVVAQVQGIEVELLATPTTIQLYLRSRAGQPIDLARSAAQVTLRSGIDQQVVALKPAGNRLEAAGQFVVTPGTQVVATVGGPGHEPVTARFTLR